MNVYRHIMLGGYVREEKKTGDLYAKKVVTGIVVPVE